MLRVLSDLSDWASSRRFSGFAPAGAEGRTVSRGHVARYIHHHGIRDLAGRRFRPCTTDSRHDLRIAPNLLKQAFRAKASNTVWLADITYIATGEGKFYLAAVLDLATRKIVGWSMLDRERTELMMAIQRQHPRAGLMRHSDLGSQYAAGVHRKQLTTMAATPLMSRTGCCYDNTPMESFFHTLKVELALVVLPRRWVVERTFGWMTRHRRLVRDYKARMDVSEATIHIAMGGCLAQRLAHP